jgi:hypothetical protein
MVMLSNIWQEKRGQAAAKEERTMVFAAMAEAALLRVSVCER